MVRSRRRGRPRAAWAVVWSGLTILVALGVAFLAPSQPAYAIEQLLGSAIPVGTNPFYVAADPVHNRIYVLNKGSITIIDGRTNARIDPPIAIASTAQGIAVNPTNQRLYVTNATAGKVTVIDVSDANNAILGSPLTAGTSPSGVAVDPTNNRVYVVNTGNNNVSLVDGSNANGGAGAVIGSTVAVGSNPLDAAANATVTLNGAAAASNQTVTLPANTTTQTFTVRRAAPGKATTVKFTVTDACGSWPTFVGGGPTAGF